MIFYINIKIKGWAGIALFPFIFIKKERKGDLKLINHEKIHLSQQKELFILFFYALYVAFYLINKAKGMNNKSAYRNIPFEKEAYKNQGNLKYLKNRPLYNWINTSFG